MLSPGSTTSPAALSAPSPRFDKCPVLGYACVELRDLACSLDQAGRLAHPASPDMDIMGISNLEGCACGCSAWFRIAPSGVTIWCEADD